MGSGAGDNGSLWRREGVELSIDEPLTSNAAYAIDTTSVEHGPDGKVCAWIRMQYHQP
jgi:hypothetical protein